MTIRKEKGRLLKGLDLAISELKTVEQTNPAANIEIDGQQLAIPMIKSHVYRLRGIIHAIAGDMKNAVNNLESSLQDFELQDTHYDLACTLETMKELRKSYNTYKKCVDLEPDSEIGIQARKDLQRLESKKVGNKFFAGSWKVMLTLSTLALLNLIVVISGAEFSPGILGFLTSGIVAAIYWKVKTK